MFEVPKDTMDEFEEILEKHFLKFGILLYFKILACLSVRYLSGIIFGSMCCCLLAFGGARRLSIVWFVSDNLSFWFSSIFNFF